MHIGGAAGEGNRPASLHLEESGKRKKVYDHHTMSLGITEHFSPVILVDLIQSAAQITYPCELDGDLVYARAHIRLERATIV